MLRRLDRLGLNVGFYLYQARRGVLLALIPALVVAALTYAYVSHRVKTYQATAVLFVQQSQSNAAGFAGSTDVTQSTQLAAAYATMITDQTISNEANVILDKKYPGYSIKYSTGQPAQTSAQQNTQTFTVGVTDSIPARAIAAVNTVANVFINRIRSLENTRFSADETRLQQEVSQTNTSIGTLTSQISSYSGSRAGLTALKAALNAYESSYAALINSLNNFRATRDANLSQVSVYSAATLATPTGPDPARDALFAGVIVLALAVLALYLYDYVNDLPRSPEDVIAAAGAPLVGTVQSFDSSNLRTAMMVRDAPRSPEAEAYRLMRTNIQFTDVERPPRSLLVTSSLPSEGKSTTVGNLAQAFAEMGDHVTVVDADLRRPTLHRLFESTEAEKKTGLTSMLVSDVQKNGRSTTLLDAPNLSVVTSGPLPPDPSNLLATDRMRRLVEWFAETSGIVLIDSPPVLAAADAAILSTMVDGVILVVDPHMTRRRDIRNSRATIEAVGGKVVGVLLNRLRARGSIYYS